MDGDCTKHAANKAHMLKASLDQARSQALGW
jgi:Tfp pilus assembly protein FimT